MPSASNDAAGPAVAGAAASAPTLAGPVRRRVASPLLVLPVAAALALAGCSGGSEDDGGTDTRPTRCVDYSTAKDTAAVLVPIAPAAVTVTSPGAQPHAVPQPVLDRESVLTTRLTGRTADPGGAAADVELPLTAAVNCADATDAEFVFDAPRSQAQALAGKLDAVSGSKAGAALGPGHAPVSARFIPQEKASQEARGAAEQTFLEALLRSVTLPTTPVGVGATWQAKRTVTTASLTLEQTITATLTAWQGTVLEVSFDIEESPVNDVYRLPSGQALQIVRYSMAGKGTAVIDLRRPLPVAGSTRMSGAQELSGADTTRTLAQPLAYTSTWASA